MDWDIVITTSFEWGGTFVVIYGVWKWAKIQMEVMWENVQRGGGYWGGIGAMLFSLFIIYALVVVWHREEVEKAPMVGIQIVLLIAYVKGIYRGWEKRNWTTYFKP